MSEKSFAIPLIILFCLVQVTFSLNCGSLTHSQEHEANGTVSTQFVPELEESDCKELVSCLATIGQAPIPQEQAKTIWNSVKKYFSRIDDIPVECFKFMGYALAGIPVEDFQNITLDNIDIVEVFGKYHALRPEQMAALAEGIIRDWSEKVPETLSEFDLMAMGQILCYFNKTDILRIHPDAYKGAAQVIGELRECKPEVIQAFAELAVQKKAFGPAASWSPYDVSKVGNVINGLSAEEAAGIPEEYIKDMKKKRLSENKSVDE